MNPYGSYKKLLHNSKQAVFAAIEIYNKPKFEYREEILVILLINAWQLFLLAVLSKNKKRIFQKKIRGRPYRTLDFNDSYKQASKFFTSFKESDIQAIKYNLDKINTYRNKAVHYYGQKPTQHAIFALSQSAIKNYVDLLKEIFNEDITNEMNIVLLPLSFNKQPDFVEFFKNNKVDHNDFIKELFTNLRYLEDLNADTNRFITRFSVKIENVNSIKSSDLTTPYDQGSNPVAIKKVNPDDTYPFYQSDIIGSKKKEKHKKFKKDINRYVFQAIVYKYKLKTQEKYCWQSKKGGSPRYSYEVINFINELSDEDISQAIQEYKNARAKS